MTDRPRILALFGSAVVFGQERGNIEALAALREQGCKVLCLVRDEAWCTLIPATLEARGLAWSKVPYIEHWMPGRLRWVLFRNPIAFLWANWRFMKIVQEFKPTHIHAFNQLYVLNFLIALMLVRTPMIYRAGDEPTIHNWVWRAVWRFVVRRVDRFVANSQFVARSLCSHHVARDRVTVIYNAPPGRVGGGDRPLSLNLPSNARAIVFIGQISEHKGVHVLVDAFRSLARDYPDARLLVAGRISDWSGDAWGQRLKDRVASDPIIRERVAFLGYVEDVPILLARSEIHVTPSLFNDPSPNVVMEAKLASKPSVVFPRGGLPELIDHGVDGLICHEATVPALAAALRSYLDDATLVQRHGKAAFASLKRLGIPDFKRRWLEVYSATSHLKISNAFRDDQ
jgi:glycosyltransferase involved in cell wall biosynthesis